MTGPEPVAAEASRAMPPPFFFIRHGETDWNREGRLQGQRDIPLNPRGRDQASAAGRILAGLARTRGLDLRHVDFVASPLGRTRQTMELLRQAMDLPPAAYRLDDRLKELSFGAWEGQTWPDIRRNDPRRVATRQADRWAFVPPEGESYAGLVGRLTPWIGSITEHAVVVAHGGVARSLMVMLAGLDVQQAPKVDIWQGRVLIFERGTAIWV